MRTRKLRNRYQNRFAKLFQAERAERVLLNFAPANIKGRCVPGTSTQGTEPLPGHNTRLLGPNFETLRSGFDVARPRFFAGFAVAECLRGSLATFVVAA